MIGVDRTAATACAGSEHGRDLLQYGADVVVRDLGEVAVGPPLSRA